MRIATPTKVPDRTSDRARESLRDDGQPGTAGSMDGAATPDQAREHPTSGGTRPRSRRRPAPSRRPDPRAGRPHSDPDRGILGRLPLDVLEALAHEIRTPMTTIYGVTKMLGPRGPVLSTAKRTEMLGGVEAEADRLYRLLEDFFAVAGVAASAGVREPVPIQHVLRDVIDDLVPALDGRRVHAFLPPGVPPVRGDVDSVAHAAHNLIESALDASPPHGIVEIVVRPGRSSVAVHIYDRGPHPVPDGAQAFVPFETSGGDRVVGPGRVLGLAASRALVEAMGGRTWAAASPDGRTETGFELPLFTMEPRPARTNGRRRARRPAHVLRARVRRGATEGRGAPPGRRGERDVKGAVAKRGASDP